MMQFWIDALQLLRQARALYRTARAHPNYERLQDKVGATMSGEWLWWEQQLEHLEPIVVNTIEGARRGGQFVPPPTLPDTPDVPADQLDVIYAQLHSTLGDMQMHLRHVDYIFAEFAHH